MQYNHIVYINGDLWTFIAVTVSSCEAGPAYARADYVQHD